MGYETPVKMPSMGIYNTDLMKMYIAGVKDQYEKGQEEMKDFMKLYGDFYSPIAGDTQRYNDMTVGGARDMINQMLANGIDPYKSPEARAAISRYINSVPTGMLNAMKQNAENRKTYDQAVAQARLAGKLDQEYEAWALKQAHLDNFSTIGPNGEIRTWDRLAPDTKQEWATIAAPYLKEFEKTEILDSDRPGYIKEGVSDENQKKGIEAVMNAAGNTPWMQYKLQQAYDRTPLIDTTGAPLSEEQRRALAIQDVRKQVENTAAQYYQPQYKDDWRAKANYENQLAIKKYWRTTGANKNSSSTTTSTEGVPSYSHSIYFQGVGSLFGIDPMTASWDMVKPNSEIGKQIASKETQMMKTRRNTANSGRAGGHPYDFRGVIRDHTVQGDADSNMKLLGVEGLKPRSGTISKGQGKTISLTENQIALSNNLKKQMKSNYILVQDNAGYASNQHYERAGFADNKNKAVYGTVTDDIVTQLSKNGRIEQYVRIILHDGDNKPIDSAYAPLQRSEQKPGGQSFAARKLYGDLQPVMLDVSKDWAGRTPKDAKATQGYMNKSQKDTDVYSEVSDDE